MANSSCQVQPSRRFSFGVNSSLHSGSLSRLSSKAKTTTGVLTRGTTSTRSSVVGKTAASNQVWEEIHSFARWHKRWCHGEPAIPCRLLMMARAKSQVPRVASAKCAPYTVHHRLSPHGKPSLKSSWNKTEDEMDNNTEDSCQAYIQYMHIYKHTYIHTSTHTYIFYPIL